MLSKDETLPENWRYGVLHDQLYIEIEYMTISDLVPDYFLFCFALFVLCFVDVVCWFGFMSELALLRAAS